MRSAGTEAARFSMHGTFRLEVVPVPLFAPSNNLNVIDNSPWDARRPTSARWVKSRSFVPNHSWTRRTHRRNTRGHVTHTGAKFTRERDVFDTDLLVAGATAAGDRTPMTLVRFWQAWLPTERLLGVRRIPVTRLHTKIPVWFYLLGNWTNSRGLQRVQFRAACAGSRNSRSPPRGGSLLNFRSAYSPNT